MESTLSSVLSSTPKRPPVRGRSGLVLLPGRDRTAAARESYLDAHFSLRIGRDQSCRQGFCCPGFRATGAELVRAAETAASGHGMELSTDSISVFATLRIDSLPSSLKLNLVPETGLDGQCERLRFILSGHLADCYEMMYWSFMVDAVNGTLSEDEDSNLYAREGFQISVNRIRDNELGFRHRHHGTWLMLRSCTRSALVLVAASRAGLESMLPADWESTIIKVVHLLRYWKDEAIDAGFYLELLEAVSV